MKIDRFDARLLMNLQDILDIEKRKNFVKFVPNNPDEQLAELDRYHDLIYMNNLPDNVENKHLFSHVDHGFSTYQEGKLDSDNNNNNKNQPSHQFEIIVPKDEIMIKRIDKTTRILKASNKESISQLNELQKTNHNYSFMYHDDILYPYFTFLKLDEETREILLNNKCVILKEIDIPHDKNLKDDISKFIDRLKNVPPEFIEFAKKTNPNSLYLHENSKYYEYYQYIKEKKQNNNNNTQDFIDFIHNYMLPNETDNNTNHNSSKSKSSRSRSRSRSRGRRRRRRSYSSSSSDSDYSRYSYSSSESSDYSSYSSDSESSYYKKRDRRRRRRSRSSSSSRSDSSYSTSSSSLSRRYRRRKRSKH